MSAKTDVFAIRMHGRPADLRSPVTVANPDDHTIAFATMAVWDTGSPICFISCELMKRLGLTFESEMHGHGLFSDGVTTFGTVSIRVVSSGRYIDVKAGVVPDLHRGNGCHALIGMNLIGLGQLSLSYLDGVTVFSFSVPALESPDLVDRAVSGDVPAEFDYIDLDEVAM